MISDSKLIEIIDYLESNDFNATLVKFNLSPQSLVRYIALAKSKQLKRRIPKILLLDIEISPIIGIFFDIFKPVFSEDKILKDWNIICWAAKWLFEPNIISDRLTSVEAVAGDDARISKSIYELMNEADIIITYNGNRFDIKRLNTRFAIHKMPPTKNFISLDLYETVKKRFAFTRGNLDYVSKLMVNKQKIETDINLWKECINGSEEALRKMDEYCQNDTLLLEEVYVELRPWVKYHPNIAVLSEAFDHCCPACGSYKVTDAGEYFTPAGMYTSFRCNDCGYYSRLRKNSLPKLTKKTLLS